MSYEIIKRIRIADGKVFLTSSSNNVYPKDWNEWECKSLSAILTDKGEEALDLELLKQYESGIFKKGIENKWSRAISRLKHTPEYANYDWRMSRYSDDCPIEKARKSDAFNKFLLSAFALKPPTDKYILRKKGTDYYVCRVTTRSIRSVPDRSRAKVFKYKEDAQFIANNYPQFEMINLQS